MHGPQSSGLILSGLALRHHSMYSLAVVSVRSQIPLFLFVHVIFVRLYGLRCADFIPSTLQCCTIEVYRLLYTYIYYILLWLYNLFVRDPAPYECSDQTRTICVNTKAERHVVAKSGDTTIPLPFKCLQLKITTKNCNKFNFF